MRTSWTLLPRTRRPRSPLEDRGGPILGPPGDDGHGRAATTAAAGPRNGSRPVALGIVVVVVCSALSWWLGSRVKSPAQAAAEAAPPPASPITAPVEYRVLSDSLVLRGTVEAPGKAAVTVESAPEESRLVVTGVPLRPGSAAGEGSLLVEVSGRPVFLLEGSVPAYRDLRPGLRGKDVAQLQAALARLGFGPGEHDGRFGRGTAAAVRRLYHARGYEPRTVPVEAAPPAAAGRDAREPAQGGAHQETASSSAAQATPPSRTDVVVPYTEITFLDRLPARVTTVTASVGSKPDGPLLELASGELVVEAELTADTRPQVRAGAPARIDAELLGTQLSGRVAEVAAASASTNSTGGPREDTAGSDAGGEGGDGPSAEAGGQTGPAAPYVVRITTSRPIPTRLLGQDVRIRIQTASTKRKALVVPLAAVWADADGTSHVTEFGPGGSQVTVRVEPGVSAGGYVAVRQVGHELRPGDAVVVGARAADG